MVLLRTFVSGTHRRAPARAALAVGLAMAWLVAGGQSPERTDETSIDVPDPAESTPETADATPEPGQLTPADLPSEVSLTRLEVQIEFIELVNQSRFEEALPLAEAIIPLTTEEFGSPSTELATALSNLAIVQSNLQDYEASKDTFLRAIDMYREVEGTYAESVITPLISLGANYRATGDYAQALGLFQEARTVNRRNFGLLNPDQVNIVYHIAATLASMQQYEEAHLQQEDALRLMERVYGTDTMEVLPYIYEYAEWLVNTFQFEPGRVQYVRAMDIIRARDGEESIELVEPLTEIGNSYRAQKLAEGRGISALKRALEIAEAHRDEDPVALARVLRDIGDWYTAFSRIGATGEEYERAWQLLAEADNGETLRAAWFAEPNYVLREYPSNRGLAEPGDPNALEGYVRVIFDVDEAGEPLNVRVLEADPPEFKDTTMVRSIRRSRFRPRVVDGEVVYSSGLIRNFTFHYVPEE